ncbi:hypothetical protein [Tolypothrix sp. VBCCA 56010]|uniref:hypothetical protein n=1 Tax=Tolypothrix sp. VBCCA 56010 TaxID=3137731 RepID=UPI003D7EBCFC
MPQRNGSRYNALNPRNALPRKPPHGTGFATHCQTYAQCPMPNAQCPMPNAQCPITN